MKTAHAITEDDRTEMYQEYLSNGGELGRAQWSAKMSFLLGLIDSGRDDDKTEAMITNLSRALYV